MILRRLTTAIRQQDWFTVTVEIIIVVLGVFIGLQVNNWNEWREDRAREDVYLERLSADMANSLEDRRRAAAWDAERLRTQQVVLAALRSGELDPQDRVDFDTGLLLFGYVNEPLVRWGTAEELESTGNLTVIRDLALREAIARMQAEIARRSALDDALTRSIEALRARIANRFEIVDFDFASERASTLRHDFPALAADAELQNLLSQIDYYSQTKINNSDALASAADELRLELTTRHTANREPAQ